MKRILMAKRVLNMRLLDTLGCLSNSSNPPEQLAALKGITSKDNVHLTEAGYRALAEGLLQEAISLRTPREKGKETVSRQLTVTWNGFVSHVGIGKTSLKSAKKSAAASRPTPYSRKNR